jgi:uncharacterized protein YjbJ (UPF0337 family)
MSRLKALKNEIAGKAKQVAGKVFGDQQLQQEGRAQERDGKRDKDEPSDFNPLGRLKDLT